MVTLKTTPEHGQIVILKNIEILLTQILTLQARDYAERTNKDVDEYVNRILGFADEDLKQFLSENQTS